MESNGIQRNPLGIQWNPFMIDVMQWDSMESNDNSMEFIDGPMEFNGIH